MSFSSSTLQLAVPAQKTLGKDAVSSANRQMPTSLQVKSRAIHEPPCLKLSRRDAMICFTTSVTTLLPMGPANAHIMNADIMQMLMEKLEKFREMVGISKPKGDSSSNGEVKKPPVPLNDKPKDKNDKSHEKAGNSKHEPKEMGEKPQEKAENSKPKPDVSGGNEKPAAFKNSSSTEKSVEGIGDGCISL